MFKLIDEVKLNDKCSTVSFNDDYFAFSEGSHIKIFNKEMINMIKKTDPNYTIKSNNTIIHSRFMGNSKSL